MIYIGQHQHTTSVTKAFVIYFHGTYIPDPIYFSIMIGPWNKIVLWFYRIVDRIDLMKLYHFIRTRTFYKVRSPLWLLLTLSIFCYESFFTPCRFSSWHIQNMLFIIDPGRQLNKGSILMGHSFLFIFHFTSICGEYFWCNISTKHWILNSYFPQTFWNCYDTQLAVSFLHTMD